MTISDTANRVQYTGNGVADTFSTGSIIFYDDTDLIVTERVTATGVETVLTLGAGNDYTVTGGDGSAGSVVLTAGALPATKTITIERSIPYSQDDQYPEGEAILAEVLETRLDKLTVLAQQTRDATDRSVKLSSTLSSSLVPVISSAPSDGAALVWDGATGSIANGPTATEIANAEASATAAAASASAASTSETNAANSATAAQAALESLGAVAELGENNTFTGDNIFQGVVDVTNVNAEGSGGGHLRTSGGTNCLSWGGGGSANLTAGGNLSMDTTHKIVNCADPTSAQDVATKAYVDSAGRPILHIQDQKSAGTDGGSFSSGAWRTRDLNTEMTDDIGSTLSSNQFTLPVGTYFIRARAPAHGVGYHKAKLYNVTDTADVLIGSTVRSRLASESGSTVTNDSWVIGEFTIADTKTFEIQHICSDTYSEGFGRGNSFSVIEVYTDVYIEKVG